jgi:hypothetical protein
LEQRLLHESDKLTNLIGAKSLTSSDTRSVKELGSGRMKNLEANPRHSCLSAVLAEEESEQNTKTSVLIQSYIQNKRKMLLSPKSLSRPPTKNKESELQRKLTYNLVMNKKGE